MISRKKPNAFILKELTGPHNKKGKKDSWETFSRVSVRNTVYLIDFVCVHTNNQNRWDPTSPLSLHHTGPAEDAKDLGAKLDLRSHWSKFRISGETGTTDTQ